MTIDTTERLAALRAAMAKGGSDGPIDALLVPHDDSHLSEQVATRFERLEYISGFTGSAGSALITNDIACLWTDGRYHLQASEQLDSNWTLMKAGLPGVPTEEEYIQSLSGSLKIGFDAYCTSFKRWQSLHKQLESTHHTLHPLYSNPIDSVWPDCPTLPKTRVNVLALEHAGVDWPEKVKQVRSEMEAKQCDWLIITALDESAWLFNLRCCDVPNTPTFYCYTVIGLDEISLYVDLDKIDDQVRGHLQGVSIKPYNDVATDVVKLSGTAKKVWIDSTCNYALASQMPKDALHIDMTPTMTLKAIKNPTELTGARNCQIRDAAALCTYLHWLEGQVKANAKIDEVEAANELLKIRQEQDMFVFASFDTISAMGPNGSIVHYRAEKDTAALVTDQSLYLLDSGGQYLDGTTDITRTVHFGTPTDYQRHCYTLVLKGHIAMATVIFPNGTSGHRLDLLGRLALWKEGLDYMHGTGHGIGSYLNVHEGPQRVTHKGGFVGDYPMKAGMVTSNEPGYYEDGSFGIRIENDMVTVPYKAKHDPHAIGSLSFETLTLVPMARNLIDVTLLTEGEREWLDTYHGMVRERVSPLLKKQGKTEVVDWLEKACRPLE